MKKLLILAKLFTVYFIFFFTNIGLEKNIIHCEVKEVITEDIKSSMCFATRYINHEIVINKEILIYKLKEMLPLSLKSYSFEKKSIKIGYVYEKYGIKGVQICLIYRKKLIIDNIKVQYMIQYLI